PTLFPYTTLFRSLGEVVRKPIELSAGREIERSFKQRTKRLRCLYQPHYGLWREMSNGEARNGDLPRLFATLVFPPRHPKAEAARVVDHDRPRYPAGKRGCINLWKVQLSWQSHHLEA